MATDYTPSSRNWRRGSSYLKRVGRSPRLQIVFVASQRNLAQNLRIITFYNHQLCELSLRSGGLEGLGASGRRVLGMIRAVVFDVGECLVNETREYGTWADWLGVPRHTFSAMFGAVIARGLDYRETFQVFAPG